MRARRIDLTGALLVVRVGKGRGLPPEAVSDALGLPLAGMVRDDPRVPRLAAQGASVGSRPAARLLQLKNTIFLMCFMPSGASFISLLSRNCRRRILTCACSL